MAVDRAPCPIPETQPATARKGHSIVGHSTHTSLSRLVLYIHPDIKGILVENITYSWPYLDLPIHAAESQLWAWL
jgi:hypothetical protein